MRCPWFSLLIPVLVMLLAAACGPVPLAGPKSAMPTSPAASDLLAGTIAGLDPGASASLRLERLALRQPSDQDQAVLRFSVTNGRWQQTSLALSPGRYRLVPEAEGCVRIRGTITFQVPEAGIIWRYAHLDFEFLHPENAPICLSVPFCPEPPAHGGTSILPEGTPTPTPIPLPPAPPPLIPPGPETWPPGTCYAGHFGNAWVLPAGLQGQISGLPTGQVATITLCALPPVPSENYLLGPAPPRDGSWTYRPEVTSLAERPVIAPDWPLTAGLPFERLRLEPSFLGVVVEGALALSLASLLALVPTTYLSREIAHGIDGGLTVIHRFLQVTISSIRLMQIPC